MRHRELQAAISWISWGSFSEPRRYALEVKRSVRHRTEVANRPLPCSDLAAVRVVGLGVVLVGHAVAVLVALVPAAAMQLPAVVGLHPARLDVVVAVALLFPMAGLPDVLLALH